MSLKRSSASGRSAFGGSEAGAKVDRQELFDELKRLGAAGESFTPVDVWLVVHPDLQHTGRVRAVLGHLAHAMERAAVMA